MELSINPYHKNNYPIGGILIKHTSIRHWMAEIQRMHLMLQEITIYPIPDTTANSIWGCLLIYSGKIDTGNLGRNELCQMVAANLFIPEKTILFPSVTEKEIEAKFAAEKYIMHPHFGMVELTEVFDVAAYMHIPEKDTIAITVPESGVFIPQSIKSFQIRSLSAEEVLKNLEENIFPQQKELKEEPLNIFEKIKLGFYKLLFSIGKSTNQSQSSSNQSYVNQNKHSSADGLFAKIESWFQRISNTRWSRKIQEDFESLEKRNQKQINKLMDLFKNNPEEALKYAIPLDERGTSRGSDKSPLDLSKRWLDLSWLQSPQNRGGGTVDLGNHYYDLQRQYYETAQALLDKKDYQKAAFVYLKLLKNYHSAAQALESGKYYQEAATIYIKHANNKVKAAECYENGKMTHEAIKLYTELNENEKVGDLYVSINQSGRANHYYEKVVDDYKGRSQYVKASLIYKNKIRNTTQAQSLLLEGWRSNRDASNCLNNYFANIADIKELKNEIHAVYQNEINEHNSETFLTVLEHEYAKSNELAEPVRDIAYEIIAKNIQSNPSLSSLLKGFNKKDNQLLKDTLRYKQNRKAK